MKIKLTQNPRLSREERFKKEWGYWYNEDGGKALIDRLHGDHYYKIDPKTDLQIGPPCFIQEDEK